VEARAPMPYIDGKLASGERVLRREHQHWFVLVADARYGILAIVAAILLLILRGAARTTGQFDTLIGYVVLALVLGGLGYLGWQILRWFNEEFVVTTRRVLQMEGVLNKQLVDSSLEKINDAVLTQSIFGRIFGFGDLDILTASESGISRLRMLKDADGFKRAMLDAKHELELELSGARPLPSPPLRASSGTPSGAGPAPSSAPSPEPRHSEMTPDELTRTLASLADLRDRGAISPEEYEAKKADLLRRL
jgi:PH (Pleckstrin Homology) domain-containing protein/putative oligomerization/nucleic acid binding protein